MTNPHPRGSRSATIWETGYNAGRWTPRALCPYVQPHAVALWKAGRDAAWEDYNRSAILDAERRMANKENDHD